jgi:hypothetical protein
MLSALWKESSEKRYDGVHALLLLAGAFLGLLLLTLWSKGLGQPEVPAVLRTVVPWQATNITLEGNEQALFRIGFLLIPLCSVITWLLFKRYLLQKDAESAVRIAAIISIGAGVLWLITFSAVTDESIFNLASSWYVEHWKKLFPLTFSSIAVMILSCLALFQKWQLPAITLPKPWLWEMTFIGLFIAFLSYDPLSLLPGKPTATSDDMWFIMPAWDILHGKHLLVDSEAQYGLGIFYLLAAAFHFLGSSIQSLKLVEMLAHADYYVLVYLLVRSICKTRRGAILAFFFIIGGTIMRNELRFETYAEPSMTRLRNYWDILLIFTLYKDQNSKNFRWFFATCTVAALAFLYNTDIGLSVTVMAFVWAFGLPLFKNLTAGERMKAIITRIILCAAFIAGGWLLFSLFLLHVGGSWPNWNLNFAYMKLYLAGFGGMPMPVVGAYWAILGVEMAAIITAVASWLMNRNLRNAPFLLAVGLYGFLTFNYYLNRSFIANLWSISLPACLCAILLFQAYMERCKSEEYLSTLCTRLIRWPLTMLAGVFIGINLWIVIVGSWQLASTRYTHITPTAVDQTFTDQMKTSAKAIASRVPSGDRAAIISPNEALYLLESNRSSAFHVPLLEMIFTTEKMNTILTKFMKEKHPYLFVERDYKRCPMCDTVLGALAPYYTKEGSGGLLDVYRITSP